MRNLGQFCRQIVFASLLVSALACPALAGEMQYPGATTSTPTTNGEMQYPGQTLDPTIEIALGLLQSALSLF